MCILEEIVCEDLKKFILFFVVLFGPFLCQAQPDTLSLQALDVFRHNAGILYDEFQNRIIKYSSTPVSSFNNRMPNEIINNDWQLIALVIIENRGPNLKPCRLKEIESAKLIPYLFIPPLYRPRYGLVLEKPVIKEDRVLVRMSVRKVKRTSPSLRKKYKKFKWEYLNDWDFIVEFREGRAARFYGYVTVDKGNICAEPSELRVVNLIP